MSLSRHFTLSKASAEDAEEITLHCELPACADNPFRRIMFPSDPTPTEAEKLWTVRDMQETLKHPETLAWKACDDRKQGRIVGFACWHVDNGFRSLGLRPLESQEKQPASPIPPTLDLTAWREVSRLLATEKRRLLKPFDRVLRLEMISVPPDHQRQGIGSLLMMKGCEYADRAGLDSFVMASPAAVKLYENFRYRIEGRVGFGDAVFCSMVRKAGTDGDSF